MSKKSTPTTDITEFVMQHPLFGAHSHIQPVPEWARTQPHASSLAGYANADLVTAAGPRALGETLLPSPEDKSFTKQYFELWRRSRFTGYCKATELACRDLLGVDYVEKNATAIGKAVGELVGEDPLASFREVIFKRANVRWLIKDHINQAHETADELYPTDFVRFNYRDDDLLNIISRDDVFLREKRWNRSIHSVSELVDGLNQSISDCLATGKVTSCIPGTTVSSSQEPNTGVVHITHAAAEEVRPLQDYLVHQYTRRIEAEKLGFQVHTGYLAGNSEVLNNIPAMNLVPLILRYPRVRFDLFHAGWPYTEEHAAIGKHFPNVWLNLCWAWAMNPVTMELALDSWLAAVPHTKIFGYGGDTGSPICEYGYAQQARIGIARVLQKWIDRGDMTLVDAEEVAADIMLLNGCRFHGLEA